MMNGSLNGHTNGTNGNGQRALKRYIAVYDFGPLRADELALNRGDILLVADEFEDGWVRGLRLTDLEIGFFPGSFLAEDTSPIYKLQEIQLPNKHYVNDPKFADYDSSKRSKIALEIYTSEEAYLAKLRMLDEKFVMSLAHDSVISPEDYGPVFSNIQPLLSLSKSLITQLKSRMEGWDERFTRIGDIFMHMGHHMKLFVSYAVQHTLGSQILAKISRQEKFKAWLERTEMECQRTLNSLLLEPIQRVPRYEMLLKDLVKHTSESHPDFLTLKQALDLAQRIATDCNENIRRAENELKLFTISKRFPHDEVDIVTAKKLFNPSDSSRRKMSAGNVKRGRTRSSGNIELRSPSRNDGSMSFRSFFESEHQRVFLKEGMVNKTRPDFTDPSERYLFLCSDVLLIAQPTSRSRKTFKLRERVMLVHAWITDALMADTTSDRGFILGTPRKAYHFMAASVEEKQMWFSELRSAIFVHKRLFNKLLSHLSIPDESFLCMKVKSKVTYLGMLKDELSFRVGDEISIVGFKDNYRKWKPGLYAQEPFDPSPEWYFGIRKDSYGWFPMSCTLGLDGRPLEPTPEELHPAPMCIVLGMKQRMIELTGRVIPPLTENERMAKVYLGEGNFKTLRIPPLCRVEDVVRMYFRVKPDSNLVWSLIEQSMDETVRRVLDPAEDPSSAVDLWGKSRDQMKFVMKQAIINSMGDSEA